MIYAVASHVVAFILGAYASAFILGMVVNSKLED